MKFSIIVAGLVMGFAVCGKAQLKKPFPDSSAAWIISRTTIDYPNVYTSSFRYYINGDTTCDSNSYKKLCEGINDLFDSTVYAYNLKGLFRVDSNKVFYKNINQPFEMFGFTDTNEVLLYDFSLTVGDSIMNYNDGTMQNYVKVVSIDTIELNGEFIKRWHFDEYYAEQLTWLEGIGSNIGFFNYFLFFEGADRLACFYENGQYYKVGIADSSSCETVGIQDNQNINDFIIFPNPSCRAFTVDLSSSSDEPNNISIYNTTGKLIQSFQTSDKSFQIDLKDHPCGVYVLMISNDIFQSVQRLLLLK